MTSPKLPWQVQVNEQIYEANFDELCQWILEGAVLPHDKVRRGNLRWLEAEKVPELHGFFNLTPFDQSQNGVNLNDGETTVIENKTENFVAAQNISPNDENESIFSGIISEFCSVHAQAESVYACDTCENSFCKTCPKSFGSVKICPMCGAMCRLFADVPEEKKTIGAVFKPYAQSDEENGFVDPEELLKQLGFAGTLRSLSYTAKQISNQTLNKILNPVDSIKALKNGFRQKKKIERLPRYFNPDR